MYFHRFRSQEPEMSITTNGQPKVRRLWQRFLPLEVLPRKLRLRMLRDVLGRESLRSPVRAHRAADAVTSERAFAGHFERLSIGLVGA